jgi:hypothetical protein
LSGKIGIHKEEITKKLATVPRGLAALQWLQGKRDIMTLNDFPRIHKELECRILALTGRRVRNLHIKLTREGVLLQGETQTYYVKQLAQHGVREVLPDVRLDNAIHVG